MRQLLCGLLALALASSTAAGADKPADKETAKLIEALKDKDAKARRDAAMGLAAKGPAAKAAVPALIKALADKDEDVRVRAAFALGKVGEPAVEALADALKE